MVKKLNIPYGRQNVTKEDIQAVVNVLKSDFLTQGPEVPNFEKNFSKKVNSKFSIAVSNATSALHLSCLALDLQPGSRLWTSAITFVASANCALYCGASVDLIDVDKSTSNISIKDLERKLIKAKKNNKLPDIVVPVHLAGLSCEMEELKGLSEQYGFKIIEDASHAAGGSYKSSKIGSCEFSDISIFSFHPVKNLTSGEGGMVTTNCEEIYLKVKRLREHGINRENELLINQSEGPWYYEQVDLGFNYRMTDIQAALGNSQLKRLKDNTSKRHKIAKFYNQNLKEFPLKLPPYVKDNYSGMHLYVIRLDLDKIEKKHKDIFAGLKQRGIGVNLHYIPIYRQPFYKEFGFDINSFPNSEDYYSSAISIPMYPELGEDQLYYIVDNIKELIT